MWRRYHDYERKKAQGFYILGFIISLSATIIIPLSNAEAYYKHPHTGEDISPLTIPDITTREAVWSKGFQPQNLEPHRLHSTPARP